MYPINVEKRFFFKLYHEALTEKTDFGALESTVCVIAADFKRLRALVAVVAADSLRSRENGTGGVVCSCVDGTHSSSVFS